MQFSQRELVDAWTRGRLAQLSRDRDPKRLIRQRDSPSEHHKRAGRTREAENEDERWNWQLDDLYDGDSIELEIVETNWNTPFPRVEPA